MNHWHLYRLIERNGTYHTEHVESFADLDKAVSAQNKLFGQDIECQLSNILAAQPHKIFNIGVSHAN